MLVRKGGFVKKKEREVGGRSRQSSKGGRRRTNATEKNNLYSGRDFESGTKRIREDNFHHENTGPNPPEIQPLAG